MPKIINHQIQREKIAEAAYRIIRKDGIEKITVRNVAKEAGLSMGSMRYYFTSQTQLYIFCMDFICKRFEKRVLNLKYPHSDPPLDHIKRILTLLFPFDDDSRLETEVWLSFMGKSLSDPELKPLNKQIYENLYKIITQVFDLMNDFGILKPDLNREIETDRLYALVDGLGIHCITNPEQITLDRFDLIITQHLESLCIFKENKIDYANKYQ